MRRGTVRKQQLGATGLSPGEGKQGATLSTPKWDPSMEVIPRPTNVWKDKQGQQHGTTQPQCDMKDSVLGTEEHMLRRPLLRALDTARKLQQPCQLGI